MKDDVFMWMVFTIIILMMGMVFLMIFFPAIPQGMPQAGKIETIWISEGGKWHAFKRSEKDDIEPGK